MTVEIGRSVGPPYRPALAQRMLGRIDGVVRRLLRRGVTRPPRMRNTASAIHQSCDMANSVGLRQTGIGRTP